MNVSHAMRSNDRVRQWAGTAAVASIAAVLLVVTLSSDGRDLATTQTIGLALTTLVAALGLNLLSGYAGLISLGQGAFFAIGAYGAAVLRVDAGLPFAVAAVLALGICAMAGAGIALAAARLHGPQLAMVTLVFAVVIHRLLVELPRFGRLSGYPNRADHDSALVSPPTIFGVTFEPPLFGGTVPTAMIVVVGFAAISFLVYRNLASSPWGRSLRAIHTSEIMASHVGIDVSGRKIATTVIAAMFAGLAGVLYLLMYGHLQPESFTLFLGVNLLVAVILGGSGTLLGPVVGAVAVAMLSDSAILHDFVEVQQRFLSEQWYLSGEGLVALVMLVVLLVLPRGIWGTVAGWVASRQRGDNATETSASGALELESDRSASPEDSNTSLLRVVSYGKRFGGNLAVDAMDLTVEPGQVHALIGPNGAGKSTLANLISGVYRSDTGSGTFEGREIRDLRSHEIARLGIGRTFQTPMLDLERSCSDNVLLGAPSSGSSTWWACALRLPSITRTERSDAERASELLSLVGLGGSGDVPAGDLSYGQQRSLEIARVLAAMPSLVIMDEPGAGLNPAERARLAVLIGMLRDAGLGVIVVEHHMDLVRAVADQVTCMSQGATLAAGTVDEVLGDPAVIASYLGTTVAPEPELTVAGSNEEVGGVRDGG